MRLIKENLIPTLIIFLAGLVISFAVLPLEETQWAEGLRVSFAAQGEGGENTPPADGVAGSAGVLLLVLPLVKVTLLMGIGGLLTTLVRWVIRIVRRLQTGGVAQ